MSRARAFMTSAKEAGEPMFTFLRPKHMLTFDCSLLRAWWCFLRSHLDLEGHITSWPM